MHLTTIPTMSSTEQPDGKALIRFTHETGMVSCYAPETDLSLLGVGVHCLEDSGAGAVVDLVLDDVGFELVVMGQVFVMDGVAFVLAICVQAGYSDRYVKLVQRNPQGVPLAGIKAATRERFHYSAPVPE